VAQLRGVFGKLLFLVEMESRKMRENSVFFLKKRVFF